MKSALCIVIITNTVICFSAYAAEPDMLYRNAKSMGMGNTKVAGGFTYNSFIYNPALLKHVKKVKFCIVRIPFTINDTVYDFANFINDESNNILNYGELDNEGKKSLINEITKREGTWGRLIFSPMFDMAFAIGRHRFGLAGFATNRIGIKMDRGIYEPRVFGKGSSTVSLVFGYARPLDILTPGLNAGVNMKFLQRHKTNDFHLRARDIGNIFETSKPIYEEYKKKNVNLFVFDVGMLYEIPSINSFAGATVQFLGMGDYTSVDLGFTRQMMRKRLAVSVDYIDFLDNNKENIFKKIHAGAEYRYLFFAFRGGINSGYPTVGLGLYFKIVDLDFAIYSEEMSKRPGALREDRYMVQMKIGW